MKYKAQDYLLYLLSRRDRSIGEAREKMQAKQYDPAEIETVIKNFIAKGLLDDDRFTTNFIRSSLSAKPQGKYLLRQKLKQRHIDAEIIDKHLSEESGIDEGSLVLEAAKRWMARHQNLDKEKERNKLGQYLSRQGFSYDRTKNILDTIIH